MAVITNTIHQRLKDALEDIRNRKNELERPDEPTWREVKDMNHRDWKNLAEDTFDAYDNATALLDDATSTLLKLFVDCGPCGVGETPEHAIRAFEDEASDGDGEDTEILEVHETPDKEFELGADWKSPDGRHRDGCLYEVPGGFVLTHIDL